MAGAQQLLSVCNEEASIGGANKGCTDRGRSSADSGSSDRSPLELADDGKFTAFARPDRTAHASPQAFIRVVDAQLLPWILFTAFVLDMDYTTNPNALSERGAWRPAVGPRRRRLGRSGECHIPCSSFAFCLVVPFLILARDHRGVVAGKLYR